MADCLAYGNKFARAVFEAEADVAKATLAYNRGGSCEAVNRANSKLARAHCEWREWDGGNIPDDRY